MCSYTELHNLPHNPVPLNRQDMSWTKGEYLSFFESIINPQFLDQ